MTAQNDIDGRMRRRLLGVSLASVATTALAACGGSSDGGSPSPAPVGGTPPSPAPAPSPSPAPAPAPAPSPAPAPAPSPAPSPAPAPAPSPAPSPAPAPAPAPGPFKKSNKRGIAYDIASAADLAALAPAVSWWYGWGQQPQASLPADTITPYGMDFVPMLWRDGFTVANVVAWLQARPWVKHLLVCNEPNLTDQANLTPEAAVSRWLAYEQVASQANVKLVGPQMNYGTMANYSDPITWLDAFYTAYRNANGGRDPRIDYLGFHWYDYGLEDQLKRLQKYGKPFWVTEMANWHTGDGSVAIDTVGKQKDQMTKMVAMLEARADVYRYAWFMGRWSPDPHFTSLFTKNDGELSELGKHYLSLPY